MAEIITYEIKKYVTIHFFSTCFSNFLQVDISKVQSKTQCCLGIGNNARTKDFSDLFDFFPITFSNVSEYLSKVSSCKHHEFVHTPLINTDPLTTFSQQTTFNKCQGILTRKTMYQVT